MLRVCVSTFKHPGETPPITVYVGGASFSCDADCPRAQPPADLDIVTCSRRDNACVMFINEGGPAPAFGVKHSILSSTNGMDFVRMIAAGDVDGDGGGWVA